MKELVIKIDDGIYKLIMSMDKALATTAIRPSIFNAIRNGKVLPKGHGKISDLDKFEANFNEKCCGECGCCSYSYEYDRCGLFKDAETLVEADKENDE